jgi:hypothetical protein
MATNPHSRELVLSQNSIEWIRPDRRVLARVRPALSSALAHGAAGFGVGRCGRLRLLGRRFAGTQANPRTGEQQKLASDLRPLTPEHQGKPPITRYQQARRDNTKQDLKKSAKPPSPVQIRAAPPISQCKFDRLCRGSTRERHLMDYGGLQILGMTRELVP